MQKEKKTVSTYHRHMFGSIKCHSSLDGPSPEQLYEIKEMVTNAFSRSECENDERIAKIKERMISQTITTIMNAEKQNDEKILKIMSSLPHCSKPANTANPKYLLGQMSPDLISQLK
jgi:hypothetical protein